MPKCVCVCLRMCAGSHWDHAFASAGAVDISSGLLSSLTEPFSVFRPHLTLHPKTPSVSFLKDSLHKNESFMQPKQIGLFVLYSINKSPVTSCLF